MTINYSQNSFSSGEFSPSAIGRSDIANYQNGLKKSLNAFILPQGAIIKRWGTELISQVIVDLHADEKTAIYPFNASESENYMIAFETNYDSLKMSIRVFNDGREVALLEKSNINELFFRYNKVNELSSAQYGDRVIFCAAYIEPFYLQRLIDKDGEEYFIINSLKFDSTPLDQDSKINAWSDASGWPEVCCFYGNRFYLASTRSYPQTIWGSKVGLFFDFKASASLLDDDAVELTILSGKLNKINHLYGAKHFLIFTNSGEWYNSAQPITPRNFADIRLFSEYGASNIRPVPIENGLIYHQINSNNIRLVQWDWQLDSFSNDSLDFLGGHLVNQPLGMAAWRGIGALNANYIFILNSSGDIAVLGLDVNNKILNWSSWNFLFPCNSILSNGGNLFFGYYEGTAAKKSFIYTRLNQEFHFDYAFNGKFYLTDAPERYVLLFDHGVYIYSENRYFYGQFPIENGVIDHDVYEIFKNKDAEFGLPFEFQLETLPVVIPSVNGDSRYLKKRSVKLFLQVENSADINVNYLGVDYKLNELDQNFNFDNYPAFFNGQLQFDLQGYAQDATIIIKQYSPYPFKLINLTQQLSV